ncbi:MAG: hypothetical protein JWN21_1077 [Sphingomonas bacterium]|uniref:squalene/phytoene synthase family protein n=1 Tax=Sphingomonas bacterium TaxID=1895847 RepID=UPI00262C5066|nr:squalene/phytoene synthase family protein [Sphingomonas bacterium]MDB5695534.1 hypothetical protein [Sphingomonas bacterium]
MDPERALALSYAPAHARDGLAALFALDDRLRDIVRAARDPTIGLMRLTWWGDALIRLDTAPCPAEPVLTSVASLVLPAGVGGVDLEVVVDAWARLLEPEEVDLEAFAKERGRTLFLAAARVLGGPVDERIGQAGEGWALATLAQERPALLDAARPLASERFAAAFRQPWSRESRALGALALLARFDVAGMTRPGSPRRVGRLLMHRLTGW